jgi:hypothetical protein
MALRTPGRRPLAVAAVAAMALFMTPAVSSAANSTNNNAVKPLPISDAQLQATTTTMGGASVLPTTRTVAHWWGSSLDPSNGVTYGYNMVGADPNTCTGSECSVTIQADITPIVVNVGGMTFSGSDVVGPTVASPQFATNDYGSTAAATAADMSKGAGGALSQGDAGNALQLQDATMRAQFSKTGASGYHLKLNPNVLPAVTINVPSNEGTLLQNPRGVVFGDINIRWWAAQIQRLETKADPTHLPIYLTDSVVLYQGSPLNCCVIGFHGAQAEANGGSTHAQGNAKVQTFAWASWARPGIAGDWALQDIHALSHEIAEWADDPFANNTAEPWLTPTAPQYGCTPYLETGDPVVGIGFAMGTNTHDQGADPDGTQSADGYYHPEDEAFLPWFMRTSPNTVSEPTQSQSVNGGRYTLMGDLNPFPGFRAPATGCS